MLAFHEQSSFFDAMQFLLCFRWLLRFLKCSCAQTASSLIVIVQFALWKLVFGFFGDKLILLATAANFFANE